jgi:hypothetical protein
MQALQAAPILQNFADDQRYRQTALDWTKQQQGGVSPAAVQSAPGMGFGPALGMAPQGAPAPRLSTSKQSDYQVAIERAKFYQNAGLPPKYVEAAYAMAEKLRPEIKETRALTDPNTGARVMVNIFKDGTQEVVPFGPDAEKAHFLDTGSQVGAVDPFTGKPIAGGGLYNKTVTPGEQLSASTTMRGQNMTDARARELNALTRSAGEVRETAGGLVRIGRDNSVTPIMANGVPLQPAPSAAIKQQIASNTVTLDKVDRAISMVAQTPSAFGLKNYAGDTVRQRTDPGGVTARALIADIAGQKIHDRSGAAVTVGEAERLRPYVPNTTDTPGTIAKKLTLFKSEYQQMQRELMGGKSVAEVADRRAGGRSGSIRSRADAILAGE